MFAPFSRIWIACAVVMAIGASPSRAQNAPDPLAAVDAEISAAEDSLRAGELEIAESRYRSALAAGWMLIGALDAAERRLADARDAFLRASTSAFDARSALQSLAIVHLQMGHAADAVTLLTRLIGANPADIQNRRLLAQSLIANGQVDEALQELEETAHRRPDDPEIKYAIASGYLRVKKIDAAAHGPAVTLAEASADPRGGAWLSSGVIIYAPSNRESLLQVSASGGQATAIFGKRLAWRNLGR